MSVLNDFESWKDFLASRLSQAQEHGMSDKTVVGLAHEVGDYLAESVAAENSEQAILKDLWNVASEKEQQALASTMVKVVKEHGNIN